MDRRSNHDEDERDGRRSRRESSERHARMIALFSELQNMLRFPGGMFEEHASPSPSPSPPRRIRSRSRSPLMRGTRPGSPRGVPATTASPHQPTVIDIFDDDDTVEMNVSEGLRAELEPDRHHDITPDYPPHTGGDQQSNALMVTAMDNGRVVTESAAADGLRAEPEPDSHRVLTPDNLPHSGGAQQSEALTVTAVDNGRVCVVTERANADLDDIGSSVLNAFNSVNADAILSRHANPINPDSNSANGGGGVPPLAPPAPPGPVPPPQSLNWAPSLVHNQGMGSQDGPVYGPNLPAVCEVYQSGQRKIFLNPTSSNFALQRGCSQRWMTNWTGFREAYIKSRFSNLTPCNRYQRGFCNNPNFAHPSANRPMGQHYYHICKVCYAASRLPFHHNALSCPFTTTFWTPSTTFVNPS